ncbi:MAG: response regulator transcription factor [Armatimonadota bacterium]
MIQNAVSSVRIALLGHNDMFREMLARTIGEQDDMTIAMEAATIEESVKALSESDADLIVMDTEYSDGSCDELIRQIKSHTPKALVAVLTANNDTEIFLSAISLGIDAYILKDKPIAQLLQSLRAIRDGFCVYDCSTFKLSITEMAKFRNRQESDSSVDLSALSFREREVTRLLVAGFSNKEIASKLGISQSTTKTHISKVFKRLGVSSRREILSKFHHIAREILPDPNNSHIFVNPPSV